MMAINKKNILFLSVVVAVSLFSSLSFANNLKIEKFGVASTDTTAKRITFSADVSWENSWRTTTNFDAVWVFLKYSTDGGTTWSHASMSASGTNPVGFSVPSGFQVVVPSDEKGFFLQRSSLGSGNVFCQNFQFSWDYGQDGLSDAIALAANTVNQVFGIEMVYIPTGSFYAGDGNSASPYRFKQGSDDEEPWYIQSENAFSTTNTAMDGFYYQSSGATGENMTGSVFLIPTSFPKGYRAFYQMKYELTEGQWVSFFNTLTPAQRINRDITSANLGGKNSQGVINRNTISWDSVTPYAPAVTLRPDRPVTYISWPDLLAYADWAGLRPMTELEYEKSARGSDVVAVANELAWGNTTVTNPETNSIYPNADENGTESILNGNVNISRNSLGWVSGDGRAGGIAENQKGPLRVGIFAESSTNRTTSGAGYYGTMELSGNLSEMVVSLGKSQGRQFLGTHGDGQLSNVSNYEGYATNLDWPGINQTDSARGVTGTSGSGYRGGDVLSSDIRYFQTSSRFFASKDADSENFYQRYDVSFGVLAGGRLVRTAP
ncbi:MAG TPA: SUMF1/EgtB/PvdO family nonheme iron enzyme [Candidatus Omnitrophota bacterium]|nr:SUMF1/EgtB/PvdO family nonheme iron enzyme [Candidatus Omnitrophota bacterium]